MLLLTCPIQLESCLLLGGDPLGTLRETPTVAPGVVAVPQALPLVHLTPSDLPPGARGGTVPLGRFSCHFWPRVPEWQNGCPQAWGAPEGVEAHSPRDKPWPMGSGRPEEKRRSSPRRPPSSAVLGHVAEWSHLLLGQLCLWLLGDQGSLSIHPHCPRDRGSPVKYLPPALFSGNQPRMTGQDAPNLNGLSNFLSHDLWVTHLDGAQLGSSASLA